MGTDGDFQGAAADLYDQKVNVGSFTEVGYSKLESLPGWSLKGSKVLDYGCGTCNYTIPMAEAGATVLAVDVSQRMIELSADKVKSKGLDDQVTLQHLRDTDQLAQLQHEGPFDAAIACYVLHHAYEHIDSILKTLHGCLKPDGKLCVLEFQDTQTSKQTRAKQMEERGAKLAEGGHGHHHGHAWVPAPELQERCAAHGFTVEHDEPFNVPDALGPDLPLDCYVLMASRR